MSALITAQYKQWDKDGEGLSRTELRAQLARDPRRVRRPSAETPQKQIGELVGDLESYKFGKTNGPPADHQVFLETEQYKVKFGDGSDEHVRGSELVWCRGLPQQTADLFTKQIFAGVKDLADTKTTPDASVRRDSVQADSRILLKDLIDMMSPDLCSFDSLNAHLATKLRRRQRAEKKAGSTKAVLPEAVTESHPAA